jgi:hypothetical protein
MQIQLDSASVQIVPTDGVEAKITDVKRRGKSALRLDYAFHGSGFATVRIPFTHKLPANYALSIDVCGNGPANNFETKLFDSTGDNVWWVKRVAYSFSKKWQRLVDKKRHFTFAWGPNSKPLTETSHLELVITSNEGGKGTVWFSNATFDELPKNYGEAEASSVSATSNNADAASVLIPGGYIGWHSSNDEAQKLRVNFAGVRAMSALVLYWGEDYATDYEVQAKMGNPRWRTIAKVTNGTGAREMHWLPDTEVSALRLVMNKSSKGNGYQVKQLAIKPVTYAPTRTDYFMRVAEYSRYGHYPRHLLNAQSFWTVVGTDGAAQKAIINEEGMLEFDVEAPSIEPFIFRNGKLLTWADGKHKHSLADGYLPVPTVVREHDGLELTITAFAEGTPGSRPTTYVRYVVKNTSNTLQTGKLFLAVRPFQVNPPWQWLNHPGGYTPVNQLKFCNDYLVVNDKQVTVYSLTPAAGFGATCHHDGGIVEQLGKGSVPSAHEIEDKDGSASGAMEYAFELLPGETHCVDIAALFGGIGVLMDPDRALGATLNYWRERLAQVGVELPGNPDLANTMKSMVAYILINRNKYAIQPGTRCYRRSWIRDGALTSSALLHWGYTKEVEQFIRWYANYVYPNGKVPCVVDRRGADPVPEHDSHGEFIYLVAEYYRHTGDKQLVKDMYPTMQNVVKYIDGLRSATLTDEYKDKPHLFGIMPPSISHEGYSAKPAFSYWDDLFVAKGLTDFAWLAKEFGGYGEKLQQSSSAHIFRLFVLSSMFYAMKLHNIDFIPGAADLGDFDATSTTIGIDPTGILVDALPDSLARTFEKYWQEFQDRRDGKKEWEGYTPYEWRVVGTFIRLGKPEIALACADWFMTHRRPSGWNHWAEVVHNDPRAPRFIGDAPHGWVGSDFLRSARSLFAYEAKDGEFADIVVGAGIKPEWWKTGVKLKNVHTHHGVLNIELLDQDGHITVRLHGTTLKAGIKLMLPEGHKSVRIFGSILPEEGVLLPPEFTAGRPWTGLGYCYWYVCSVPPQK